MDPSIEHFDVLTPDGTPTGVSKPRSDVHRDGDWHACVHIWVIDAAKKRVLLQQRVPTKDSWGGFWDTSCAGHLSAGDSPLEAAVRELSEELGLSAAPSDLLPLGRIRQQHTLPPTPTRAWPFRDNEHAHVYAFVPPPAAVPALDNLRLQESEVSAVRWADLAALVRLQCRGAPPTDASADSDATAAAGAGKASAAADADPSHGPDAGAVAEGAGASAGAAAQRAMLVPVDVPRAYCHLAFGQFADIDAVCAADTGADADIALFPADTC